MTDPLERLDDRLRAAGWAVTDSRRGEVQGDFRQAAWLLESRRVPLGVRVELHLLVWNNWGWREYWNEERLATATVRYPSVDAGPAPEATLTGEEIERENFRQLVRILEWFRDPLNGDNWAEPIRSDEWQPPTEWLTGHAVQQASLELRWGSCRDAEQMLRCMPGRASDRQLRLIACGCARLTTHAEADLDAISAAERHADGQGNRRAAKKLCKHSGVPWLTRLGPREAARHALSLVRGAPAADVVREILGNPFRPVTLRHSWLRNTGGAVAHLAAVIADEGRYEDLLILADALEDAGCGEAAILEHCRAAVTHRRGCWVLDLLRSKR
jgi:hypothetical protein